MIVGAMIVGAMIVGAMTVEAMVVGAIIVGAMIVGAKIVEAMIVEAKIIGEMIVGAKRRRPHHWVKPLRKHKTFVSHLYNVGPTSKTLGRRCIIVYKDFVFVDRCITCLSLKSNGMYGLYIKYRLNDQNKAGRKHAAF